MPKKQILNWGIIYTHAYKRGNIYSFSCTVKDFLQSLTTIIFMHRHL